MRDPIIRKTRMLLVQEQFRNERISEVTTRHQLDGVQRMFAKIWMPGKQRWMRQILSV